MVRDETQASYPGSNANNIRCYDNGSSPSGGHSWACEVTFTWNGETFTWGCAIWQDGEVECE